MRDGRSYRLTPLFLKYFQLFDLCSIDHKAYGSDFFVQSRFACCPGIDVEKIELLIIHYLKDVGMS